MLITCFYIYTCCGICICNRRQLRCPLAKCTLLFYQDQKRELCRQETYVCKQYERKTWIGTRSLRQRFDIKSIVRHAAGLVSLFTSIYYRNTTLACDLSANYILRGDSDIPFRRYRYVKTYIDDYVLEDRYKI